MKIRAARPSDKRAVREFVSRIWDEDYILDVFDEWVRDRRGRLWVAVEDGRAVAIAKLTLLGDREAWLHALRVDPDYRRRGIAGALLEHRLARAGRLGARVARLDTSEDNIAIQRLMRRHRFRRVETINVHQARPRRVAPPRIARSSEQDAVWRLVRGALFHENYVARAIAPSDVARAIRRRECFAVGPAGRPRAVAIAQRERPNKWTGGSRLRIRIAAGSRGATRDLLVALRGEAHRTGVDRAGIAATSEQWTAVRAAGFRPRWHDAMYVFEKRL